MSCKTYLILFVRGDIEPNTLQVRMLRIKKHLISFMSLTGQSLYEAQGDRSMQNRQGNDFHKEEKCCKREDCRWHGERRAANGKVLF